MLINKITLKSFTYCCLAIMRNINSLKSSTDENVQHHYCSEGETFWCYYQQHKADNKEDAFIYARTVDEKVIIEF